MMMKKLIICLYSFLFIQGLYAQNIPHANFVGPWGVEVNTFNGNLFLERTDLYIPNQGLSIQLTFSYNSFRDTIDLGYGNGWSHNYNMSYEAVGTDSMHVTQSDGRRDLFVKVDGDFEAPEGIFDTWEEYSPGQFRLTTREGMAYYFDDVSHQKLTRIEDTNGNAINLNYNGDQLTTITDHSSRSVELTWSGGKLSTLTDPNFTPARSVSYLYDGSFLTSVNDLESYTTTYGYAAIGSLNYILDARGDEMRINYNVDERVSEIATCISYLTFSYNESQDKTYVTEKNPGGDRVTTYDYDEAGKLIQKTGNCCGYNTQYQYDDDNNINQMVDANGNPFAASHDALGNILFLQDPQGASQQFSFENNLNRLVSVTDKLGNSSTLEYDTKGNLLKSTRPENVEVEFSYDGSGNLLTLTDGNDHVTSMEYNVNNDLTLLMYPIGNESFEYDAVGNLLSSTDGNNNSMHYTYDALGRVKTIRDDLNNTIQYNYDEVSNLISEIDPSENLTQYSYDAHQRLESVSTPVGTTIYSYDASDNLSSITDANFHLREFQYDARDLLIAETDAIGNTTAYTYDGNGNVSSRTDANGLTTSYVYDDLDRLISKSYDGNTDNFTYDANGNLIQCSNNHISMSFTYDQLNRLTSKTINNWNLVVSYEYDPVGNRTKMIDPTGETLYAYDDNNRLISLTNPSGETTSFQYDNGGRMTRKDFANGTYTEYSYDDANRLLGVVHRKASSNLLTQYIYTYDNNGNRLTMTNTEGIANYSYDGVDRLLSATYDGINAPNESYSYDPVGNRINFNGTTYSYDVADRLQSAGAANYEFDANGNLLLKLENGQETRYFYDGENRLIRVEMPDGNSVDFQYDPFGNRISQTQQGETIRYFLDGENVLLELDVDNNMLARYTSGLALDSWISMERSNQSYFYHQDALGSTGALTQENQNLAALYSYDTYGNILELQGSIENPYTYTGREWDDITGLYYYRSRYYDAEVGRFLTKDEFRGFEKNPLSQNRYAYVELSPTNFIDSKGDLIFIPVIKFLLASAAVSTATNVAGQYIKNDGFGCFSFRSLGEDIAKGFFSSSIVDLYGIRKVRDLSKGLKGLGRLKHRREKTLDQALKRHRKDPSIKNTNDLRREISDLRDVNMQIGSDKRNLLKEKVKTSLGVGFDAETVYNTVTGDGCDDSSGAQDDDFVGPPPPPPGDGGNPPGLPPVEIPIIRPVDPNEIIPPAGCDIQNWVAQDATLPFTILYENDPEFATAPAQIVEIEQLFEDEGAANPVSIRIGDFGFGNYYFEVPDDVSYYFTQLDLSDSLGVLLDVAAGYDADENKLFWIFQSKDPATGLTTTLPAEVGYLPVNDSITMAGQGFVSYAVSPRISTSTGDTLYAQASIIFDDNPPIITNQSFNLVDADAPETNITAIDTLSDANYLISWTGTDEGSGITSYLLYASINNGPFIPIADNLVDTEYNFIGTPGNTYAFFTIGIDCAGNIEPLKTEGDSGCALAIDEIMIEPATGMNADGSITITVIGAAGELNYTWSPNVSATATASNLTVGTYEVTIIDELGCEVMQSIQLDSIPSSTNIVQKWDDLFIHRLFPVPAYDQVAISYSAPERIVWLEVFSVDGKPIHQETLTGTPAALNEVVLEIEDWTTGTYLLKLSTRDNSISGVFFKK